MIGIPLPKTAVYREIRCDEVNHQREYVGDAGKFLGILWSILVTRDKIKSRLRSRDK